MSAEVEFVDTDTDGDTIATMPVSEIDIGVRYRTDLGDLDALAASISDVGLLQPIVVTDDGLLVAGQRRLEAVKRLGWDRVDVYTVATLTDARSRLVAERDENTARKDMTASEMYALGKALEELERPRAEQSEASTRFAGRDEEGNPIRAGSVDPARSTGRTYEHVAPSIGMSPPQWKRLKHIGDRAVDGDEQAHETLQDIDQGAQTISGGYNALPGKQKEGEPLDAKPDSNGSAITPRTKTHKGRSAADGGRRVINNLIGLTGPLQELDPADLAPTAEEAAAWNRDLSAAESAIRKLRKQLKGV